MGFRWQHGAENVPKTTTIEPRGCQSELRDVPKHPLGNRVEQMRITMVPSLAFGFPFWSTSIKIQCQETSKTRSPQNMEHDTKCSQNGKPPRFAIFELCFFFFGKIRKGILMFLDVLDNSYQFSLAQSHAPEFLLSTVQF